MSRSGHRFAAKTSVTLAAVLVGSAMAVGCGADGGGAASGRSGANGAESDLRGRVRVASTTSLYDTGLLDTLVAAFRSVRPGVDVQVIAVGTGQALELGRRGDADLLLVHAPDRERAFVAEGHGARRTTFMQNDFVLAGPPDDVAGVAGAVDVGGALRRIRRAGAEFVSRGDDSGTHIRERALWGRAGGVPSEDWYIEVGQGMGATLMIADERRAYVLTDRATLTTLRSNGLDLVELFAGGDGLVNVYSIVPVARTAGTGPTAAGSPEMRDAAAEFERWLLGRDAAAIIDGYGRDTYGAPLFSLIE